MLMRQGSEIPSYLFELLFDQLEIIPFGEDDALAVGILDKLTRSAGLSLGDRACLALAQRLGQSAVTTDRAWAQLVPDIFVELIR